MAVVRIYLDQRIRPHKVDGVNMYVVSPENDGFGAKVGLVAGR